MLRNATCLFLGDRTDAKIQPTANRGIEKQAYSGTGQATQNTTQ